MLKKDILVISTNPGSLEPKSGGQVRFSKLLEQLLRRNDVMVLEPRFFYRKETREPLRSFFFNDYRLGGRRLGILADFTVDYIRKLITILTTERVDVIQIYSFRGVVAARFLLKILGKKALLIYDAHNVYRNIAEYAFKDERLLVRLFCRAYVAFIERIAVKCTDHILAVSEEDKRDFVRLYKLPSDQITVVPSGVDLINASSVKGSKAIKRRLGVRPNTPVLVFHGWFNYFPNKEAITLITNYIAPQVAKIHRNAVFLIAGRDVPVVNNENTRLVGFVDDIYALIQAADIAVVPILSGGGTRLKILDYMIMGKSIVTTRKGIEGINARNGEHAIIVDRVDNKFIEAIMHLISSPHERERIGKNARDFVIREYSWDKIGDKLDRVIRTLLAENVGDHSK